MPTLGEKLSRTREPLRQICGESFKTERSVLRDISKYCTSEICVCVCVSVWGGGGDGQRGGGLKCEIAGKRQNKRGNGLKVPFKYIVKGLFLMILNVEKIIKDYLSRTTK